MHSHNVYHTWSLEFFNFFLYVFYVRYVRPMDSMPDGNCLQHGVSPLSYSHQTLQMMSTCPAVSQCSPYIQSNLQNDSNDNEYYRVQNGGQTDVAPQPHYYPVPIPFSGHASNHLNQTHLRDMRSIRPDILPIQTGPSPLDFMRNSIATHTNGHQYSAHQQKSQTGSFRNDQYFTRQETSSLSSFSDDNCDSGSGATTPASERSLASSSGLSSRASLLSVSSDGSLCSSNVSPPIFLSQPNGSYYKHLQQQQPHYITAS